MLKNEGFYQSVIVLVKDIEDEMKADISVIKLVEKFSISLDFNLNELKKRGFKPENCPWPNLRVLLIKRRFQNMNQSIINMNKQRILV